MDDDQDSGLKWGKSSDFWIFIHKLIELRNKPLSFTTPDSPFPAHKIKPKSDYWS